MANKKYFGNNSIDLSWGDGGTDLFLAPCNGVLEVFDYEYDTDYIHEMCGGKCYYMSRSGCSGAGFIEKYGNLTRVGYYRVDTVHNEFQYPVEVADGITVMLPYMSHQKDKSETLKNYPVVIQVEDDTLIYCGFYTNMNEVLATLLNGETLNQKPRIIKKTLVNVQYYCKCTEEVELKFYNLFGSRSYYPWEFATELLKNYAVDYSNERIHRILGIAMCEDGTFVHTKRIGCAVYASELLKKDICEEITESLPGWEFAENNMLYKVHDNDVYIVGWTIAATAYQKKIERIARYIHDSDVVEFKEFVKKQIPSAKYVEYEITVPKLLFFLDKEKQFAKVRKGVANKVHGDVMTAARQFVDNFNDQQILEAIPDELIIKVEDSWSSGNCKPGTQSFVDEFFPGKSEITAGELKKYAKNRNVMRVFRYIASRDMIGGKVKLELKNL